MRTIISIALAITAVAAVASADGLDGERFAPSLGIEGTFAVEHPSVPEHKDWGIGLFFNYARDQIVVRDGDTLQTHVLERAMTADLVGSFGLAGRFELGMGIPLHLVYDGAGFAAGPAALAPESGVGDIHVLPKLALIQRIEPRRRLLLSIGAPLTLPTGDAGAARGAGGFTIAPTLMFAYHKHRGLGFGFDVGYTYRSEHPQGLPYGDAITVQPWISYAATAELTLRAEVLAEKQIDAAVAGADFPVELVAGLDYRIGTVDLFFGGGLGATDGIGAPAFRVIGGIRYRHFSNGPANIGDRRGDRIVERGTGPDPDGDGIRGSADRCPDEAEDYDGFQDSDGCPEADNDKDGVPDDEDECPELPGPSTHHGCPAKTYVKVVKGRLFVFGKVQFGTNSAQIEPRSEVVLDQVATELRAHPGIVVRIDGHTDNAGGAAYNKKLAGERAAAVKLALERRGVPGKRLSTRGVGEDAPIAPNRTPAGRAKNRRVEFIIVGGK